VPGSRKVRAACISVASNTILIIMKVAVGIASGSVSILSEAVHSSIDLIAALIALISLSLSSKPADKSHPYGHGKIENISGIIEGLLIFAAAVIIITESVKKILEPQEIAATSTAVAVMLVSAVINFVVSRHLYRVAEQEDSIALEADALHLKTDIYTSLGVAVGLVAIKISGQHIIDPIAAIIVALLISRESWRLLRAAFSPLIDCRLPEDEEKVIAEILQSHENEDFRFAHLRTRKSGPNRFIDFHARVSPHISVKKAGELNRHLKEEIENCIPNVHIHVDVDTSDHV